MATELRVLYVQIRTSDGWQEPYDLDAPVVAVIGPVDTGKTSLVDCIAYALGRDIDAFHGQVDAYLREVQIGIRVSSGTYKINRSRHSSSYVHLFDEAGTLVRRLQVKNGHPEEQNLSGWLLEQLGLDDLFAAVRLPGGKSLDFPSSLLPYCYLVQDDIDTHIIQPSRSDNARLSVLRLLLNLTSEKYERTIGSIRATDNEIDRRRKHAVSIENFLKGSDVTDPRALQLKIDELEGRRSIARARLVEWRENARAASPKASNLERQRLQDARRKVGDAEDLLDQMRRKFKAACSAVESCEAGLKALTELEEQSPDQRYTLRLSYPECPACERSIASRVDPGHCYLCRQLLPGGHHIAERRRLEAAHGEAIENMDNLQRGVDQADAVALAARQGLADLVASIDELVEDSVTPFVDAIAASSAELGEIQASLTTLKKIQESYGRLVALFDAINELEVVQAERRRQIEQDGKPEHFEDVLSHLNGIFKSIVGSINLPHATGEAEIDPTTLLPLVDRQRFEQRGGGAKSAVSVAYSLTLLTYTLEHAPAKLPALLMVDSPQKNFGSNNDDKALAHRVYERFLDYTRELRAMGEGSFYRPFQVIIVDNDIHPDIQRRVKVHEFTRDTGFVRNMRPSTGPNLKDAQMIMSEISGLQTSED